MGADGSPAVSILVTSRSGKNFTNIRPTTLFVHKLKSRDKVQINSGKVIFLSTHSSNIMVNKHKN